MPDEPAEIQFFWDFDDNRRHATLNETAELAAITGDIVSSMGEPGTNATDMVSELRNKVPGPTLNPTPQQLTDMTLYGPTKFSI